MSISVEDVIPESFSGIVPLFPIPDLVMFPGVVQPLHIFEPRYRQMMKWTMGHEKLIAMASFKEGWESDYPDRPPLKPIVCIGKIIAQTQLPDGRYKLLLLGGQRAFVESELSAPQPFRTAQVRLLGDVYNAQRSDDRNQRFAKLAKLFLGYLRSKKIEEGALEVFEKGVSFGILTDIISSVLEIQSSKKYDLLQQVDVDQRADYILSQLEKTELYKDFSIQPQTCSVFPPPFSDN